jgi:hypothetical protein
MGRRHEMFLSVGAMVRQAVQTAESVHQGFSILSLPLSKEVPECDFCPDMPTFPLKESNYRAKPIEQEVRALKSFDFRGIESDS